MTRPDNPKTDWYAVLKVSADAADEEIRVSTEKLSRQAAAMATTDPDRSQQLRDCVRSIRADLLSGPAARAVYDARLTTARSAEPTEEVAPSAVALPPPTAASTGPPSAGADARSGGPPSPHRVIDAVVNGIGPAASRFRRFLQAGWTCPNCGADGGPMDKFCSRCGAAMKTPEAPGKKTCPTCSAVLGSSDRFCSRCGSTV